MSREEEKADRKALENLVLVRAVLDNIVLSDGLDVVYQTEMASAAQDLIVESYEHLKKRLGLE